MSEYEQSSMASKKWIGLRTVIMMIIFFAVYAALGALIGYIVYLFVPDFHWAYGIAVMFGIAVIVVIFALLSMKISIKKKRRMALVQKGQYQELQSLVEELAVKANIRAPSLVVISNEEPNAYACGSRKESYVVVHDSLIGMLDLDEIEGVLAHEISHIKDNDCSMTILTSRLSAVTSVISKYLGSYVVALGTKMIKKGFRSLVLIGILGAIVRVLLIIAGVLVTAFGAVFCIFYPLAALIKMAISRDREYQADRSAAYMTERPLDLAMALSKLEGIEVPFQKTQTGLADSMIISHHYANRVIEKLMRTHPPTKKRIDRLMAIDKQMNGE